MKEQFSAIWNNLNKKILVVWEFSPQFITFAHDSYLCCYCFPNKTAPVWIHQLHALRLVNVFHIDQRSPSGVLSLFASFILQRWPHVCDHSVNFVHSCMFYDWTEKIFESRQICIRIRYPLCMGLASQHGHLNDNTYWRWCLFELLGTFSTSRCFKLWTLTLSSSSEQLLANLPSWRFSADSPNWNSCCLLQVTYSYLLPTTLIQIKLHFILKKVQTKGKNVHQALCAKTSSYLLTV